MTRSSPGPNDRLPATDECSSQSAAQQAATVRAELSRLADLASAGDEVAFECLHRGLHDRVCAFFRRRLGNRDLVEELAQRTWVEVWRSLDRGQFDPERASFSTYLLGIGSKVFLRHCRTEKRTRDHTPAIHALFERQQSDREGESSVTETEHVLDLCSTLEALRDCVERARAGRRLTALDVKILERVLAGRSERETAVDIGVAPSTVNARKQAALEFLRRCLARKGIR